MKKKPLLSVTHLVESSDEAFMRFLAGDRSMLRCTLCNKAGGCDCWTKCGACGWMFEKGTKCRNCAPLRRSENTAKGKA